MSNEGYESEEGDEGTHEEDQQDCEKKKAEGQCLQQHEGKDGLLGFEEGRPRPEQTKEDRLQACEHRGGSGIGLEVDGAMGPGSRNFKKKWFFVYKIFVKIV